MSFVHLHLHTHYSLLDGLGKPEDYIIKAKNDHKAPAIAITDHGVLYGAVEFYQKCLQHRIKPIIGCEMYICKGERTDKTPENKAHHLILLAKNLQGYQNLLKLGTKASLEGFYYRPKIDYELLNLHKEGLIATSACMNGEVAASILMNEGDLTEAKKIALNYQKILGKDNFYLEVQHHPKLDDQAKVNKKMYELAADTKIPLVATNDCHYVDKTDIEAHDVLICIQTGKNVHDDNRMRYGDDFSLKSPEQMRKAFKEHEEACDNTLKIAEMCNLEIPLDNDLLPRFPTPKKEEPKKYLKKLCIEGMHKRYGKKPDKITTDRLNYELDIINKMGFSSYFLIVHDFVKYAKEQDIIVGPGRGSAAGSIIAYCLEITDLDPLKYNLLFERFLNPERVSMPDIDIDFADNKRDEVLTYVQEKYGRDRVAQIITFGTMAARAAVRDSGRALGYAYSEVDQVAKAIPSRPGTKLQEALDTELELKKLYNTNEASKKILDTALKLEGCVRHSSVHACAVVISPSDLTDFVPLQKASGQDTAIITQYSQKPVEKIGLLKMDFLGLKNLTIIETTINIIKRTKKVTIDLKKIDMHDKKSFKLLQKGMTTGVFQLESPGMKRYLKQLKPTCFEDIIAMVSLYRPGPMDWIPDYIKGKHGLKKVKYIHESLEGILKETYGIAVYQEQILQIAQKFAGFTLGEADILRRAIGKKIASELVSQRTKFIEGAIAKGHDKKLTTKMFEDVIEPFAGYGFNKSHAACYALIAFQTAYLKARYPAEFMAALLTADADNTDRVIIEIAECKEMGIKILPPSVNESLAHFTVVNDTTIRFGLTGVKGVGENTVREIIRVRDEGGKFKNIEDMATRVPQKLINKKTIEALAFCGSMDDFDERNKIVENIQIITDYAKNIQKDKNDQQTDIFGTLEEPESILKLKKARPASTIQKLKWEKIYLGMYVSAHPLQGLTKYLAKKAKPLISLTAKDLKTNLKITGIIASIKHISTRAGAQMASFILEDPTAKVDVIVFPRTYSQIGKELTESSIVILDGKMELRSGNPQFVCQSAKKVSYDRIIENAKQAGIYDPNEIIVTKNLEIELQSDVNTTEDSKKQAEPTKPPAKTFIINLKNSNDASTLSELKELLTKNQGDNPVEIHIKKDQTIQRIKVPFGIKLTDNLKQQIKKTLE